MMHAKPPEIQLHHRLPHTEETGDEVAVSLNVCIGSLDLTF